MKYIVKCKSVIATDKKWLSRNGYSKLAIKAYGYLAKSTTDPSDPTIAKLCKVSVRAYQEAKRELVYAGLLEVFRFNASTFIYYIGDKAIEEQSKAIKEKSAIRLVVKSIESLELDPVDDLEDNVTEDLYYYTDLAELAKKIAVPSPIPAIKL